MKLHCSVRELQTEQDNVASFRLKVSCIRQLHWNVGLNLFAEAIKAHSHGVVAIDTSRQRSCIVVVKTKSLWQLPSIERSPFSSPNYFFIYNDYLRVRRSMSLHSHNQLAYCFQFLLQGIRFFIVYRGNMCSSRLRVIVYA